MSISILDKQLYLLLCIVYISGTEFNHIVALLISFLLIGMIVDILALHF